MVVSGLFAPLQQPNHSIPEFVFRRGDRKYAMKYSWLPLLKSSANPSAGTMYPCAAAAAVAAAAFQRNFLADMEGAAYRPSGPGARRRRMTAGITKGRPTGRKGVCPRRWIVCSAEFCERQSPIGAEDGTRRPICSEIRFPVSMVSDLYARKRYCLNK